MKFAGYPEVRERLAEARFEALERVVSLANSEECALLAIAGDLFDRQRLAANEVQRAAEALSRFEGDVALVLPGNHDFSAPDSELWSRFRRSAGDRTLLLDRTEPVDLRHYGLPAAVYPAPCTSRRSAENNIGWIREAGPVAGVQFHIGIAHGSLAGLSPDPEQNYYPMSRDELLDLPMDIWLLGHTHVRYPEEPASGDRVFNPGTPEPDGFDCSHSGAAFVIDLEEDRPPAARIVPTGAYQFADMTLSLSPDLTSEEIVRRAADRADSTVLLRLELTGTASTETISALPAIEGTLREKVFYLELDSGGLREAVTPERIAREFPEGSFGHRLLSSLLENGDNAAADSAFALLEEARDGS